MAKKSEAPETRPAQDPEVHDAPEPQNADQAAPEVHDAPEPEIRKPVEATSQSQSEPDEDGFVELTVLREDGLQGAGGAFVGFGQRGKFPAEEAWMHLSARNARLPSADD